jgi:acyl-CoA thioester hydrolase
MNVAYYILVFDHGTDVLLDHLEVGEAYRLRTDCSTFVVEAHVTYEQEVHNGDPLRVTTQFLGFDDKRLHFFHHMYHGDTDVLVATNEIMSLHVDLQERRSAPFPAEILPRIRDLADAHARLPRPDQAGRVMALKYS